tara:strand:+ start:463 stop:762 length:300 start_codon:yes stop_codon:yes gene_type:complete
MSKQKLKTISSKLKKASKAHAGQAKQIDSVISAMPFKKSSALKKISAACKSAAKRKFKVWPSAYASGWGVRCTRAGGPSNFGGGKKKSKFGGGKKKKKK